VIQSRDLELLPAGKKMMKLTIGHCGLIRPLLLIALLVPIVIIPNLHPQSLSASESDLKPGDTIGPHNWERVKGMVGENLLNRIKQGYTFKIKQGLLQIETPLTKGQVAVQAIADISFQNVGRSRRNTHLPGSARIGLCDKTQGHHESAAKHNQFWFHVQFIDIVIFINSVK